MALPCCDDRYAYPCRRPVRRSRLRQCLPKRRNASAGSDRSAGRSQRCSGGRNRHQPRALAPCEAGIAMAGAVTRFLRADTRLLYQKMDSTLRGNWATETASALRAASALANQQMFAIVAPAFPAAGRTVVGGRGMLNGVALEKTETWAWEALTRSAQPAAWLAAEGLRVVLASIEEVRLGPDHLAAYFAEHSTVADAIVCDAETEGDLGSIAGAALALTRMPLCVGSAGLMRALARMRAPSPAASAPQGSIATAGPVVILVGSASQVSQAQVRRLAEERPVSAIMIAPSALRGGPASNLMLAYAERIDTVLTSGEDIAVAVDSGQGTDLKDGQQLTRALAELVPLRGCIALVVSSPLVGRPPGKS